MANLSREEMIRELYDMAQAEGDEWVKVDSKWITSYSPWMRNLLREFQNSRLTDLSDAQVVSAYNKRCQSAQV